MSGFRRTVAVTNRGGWSGWLRTAAVLIVTLAVALPAFAGQVTLAWDASTDVSVTGYFVYYGQASHSYTNKLNAGNQTAYTVSSLTAGQKYYFAVTTYNALGIESAFSNEVSATVSSLPPAQVGIASSLNPAAAGANVTFTATVSGNAPTGNVAFTDGGIAIGGCAAVALGGSGNIRTATCATSSLAPGSHSIVASYNGDAANGASSSSALSQVISAAASTTTVSSSLNPSTAATSVSFTATVTGNAPTGSVNFKDGATSITGCSAVALAGSGNSRTAVCTTSGLGVGTHSITASYGGNAGNSASTSTALTQVVNKANSATTLSSSANPSTSGASVTLTATVTGSAPTGSVNFKDGATSITGCSAVALTGSGNSRTAACTTSGLTVGTHNVTAAYSGDASNVTSTSTALTQVVNMANSATTLSSSANPSVSGASVTLTATVTGSAPTGSVNFKDGATSITGCSAVALTGSGNSRTAACATSGFTTGTHSVTAAYGGDASNTASTSTALSQVVNKATSATALSSSANPAMFGAGVTLTATVTGSAPTGSVNFKDGASSITGCSAVALTGAGNSRTAACTTSSLAVGTHSITAVYAGDANNTSTTSSALSQVVNSLATTSTVLSSSLNPSTSGANVTFTATVTGVAPTGTVNFKDGAASIAGCSAVALTGAGNSRTATCSTASLSVATHSITASYGGNAGNNPSTSTALSQVVQAAATPTTTTLASSLNPSTSGANVTFTATVTGTAPTGTVNFKDGAASIAGCSAVALAGSGNTRTATCSTANLSVATHSITAGYGGDAANNASTSAALSQVVNSGGASTNVALASNGGVASASSTYVGSGMSFAVASVNNGDRAGLGWGSGGGWNDATAGVYPDWVQINFSGSKTIDHVIVYSLQDNFTSPVDPPATLTFSQYGLTDFQVQGWNGSTWVTLGSASGNNLVKRSVNFTPTVTDRIRVNITGALASYSRITEIEAWTAVGGGPAPTTTTLASSLNPSTSGANVTFTATVTGSAPTGTVNFKDGAASIAGCSAVALTGAGNSRTATCSTASLSVATHSITASYGGDAGNAASTSSTLSQVVNSGAQINVALASNGGVASASSTYVGSGMSFAVASVNNGDRAGLGWGSGGGWNDATAGAYPDWVQINFSGSKTIDHVIVYTLQDNFASPVDPPAALTFSLYGITDFQVQGWNGSAWVTLGSVSGNNLVKRTVNFAPTVTDRIRVNITGALATYSRIVEIEAWGN